MAYLKVGLDAFDFKKGIFKIYMAMSVPMQMCYKREKLVDAPSNFSNTCYSPSVSYMWHYDNFLKIIIYAGFTQVRENVFSTSKV